MIKNFFLVAYRNLVKNKATSILNISGLAIGVVVCLLIGVWVQSKQPLQTLLNLCERSK
jgi:ABC-type nitrate/sulfonate/bicarbonate transport system permease component